MKALSRRTETFTDSVIRRMTRVCLKCGAVNLSQGFPDFDPPKALTEAFARAATEGPHQYAVTWGARDFREPVNNLIRLHFAKREETLNEALNWLEGMRSSF